MISRDHLISCTWNKWFICQHEWFKLCLKWLNYSLRCLIKPLCLYESNEKSQCWRSVCKWIVFLCLCCSDRVLTCVSLPELAPWAEQPDCMCVCVCVCVCRCCDLPVTEHSCPRGLSTGLLMSNICIDLSQHASVCSSLWVLLIPAQTKPTRACWSLHVHQILASYLSLKTFGQFHHL